MIKLKEKCEKIYYKCQGTSGIQQSLEVSRICVRKLHLKNLFSVFSLKKNLVTSWNFSYWIVFLLSEFFFLKISFESAPFQWKMWKLAAVNDSTEFKAIWGVCALHTDVCPNSTARHHYHCSHSSVYSSNTTPTHKPWKMLIFPLNTVIRQKQPRAINIRSTTLHHTKPR